MRLVNAALWQLLKAHTGLTDADLKQYIEKVDMADGKLDGKMDRKGGAMDCPSCARRILKTAVVCPWCTTRNTEYDNVIDRRVPLSEAVEADQYMRTRFEGWLHTLPRCSEILSARETTPSLWAQHS